MTKSRKIGVLTLGVSLVIFGVLFLLHTFIPAIDYTLIFSVWPVALILVGAEMIIAHVINKEEKLKYDGVSIFLVIAMSFFSLVMAGITFFMEQAALYGQNWWY